MFKIYLSSKTIFKFQLHWIHLIWHITAENIRKQPANGMKVVFVLTNGIDWSLQYVWMHKVRQTKTFFSHACALNSAPPFEDFSHVYISQLFVIGWPEAFVWVFAFTKLYFIRRSVYFVPLKCVRPFFVFRVCF